MRTVTLLFLAVAAVVAQGCTSSAKDTTFLEPVTVPAGSEQSGDLSGFSADAKQRFIWTPKRKIVEADGTSVDRRIICAEPSPDALSSLSSTVAASLEVDVPAEASVAAELQRSFTEAVTEIGKRTVTIQLLRDNMYRACEAFANGLIDDFGYAVILSNIDSVMIQMLALEVLSEAGAAPGDAEGAKALAAAESATIALSSAREGAKFARTRLAKAEAEQRTAQAELDEAKARLASLEAEHAKVVEDRKAEQALVDEDRNRAKTAIGNNQKPPPEIGDKQRLILLIGDDTRLAGEVAAAEARQASAIAATTRAATAVEAARSAIADSEKGVADAQRKADEANALAASVPKELPRGATGAIMHVVNKSFEPRSPQDSAVPCLIWMARVAKDRNGDTKSASAHSAHSDLYAYCKSALTNPARAPTPENRPAGNTDSFMAEKAGHS